MEGQWDLMDPSTFDELAQFPKNHQGFQLEPHQEIGKPKKMGS